MTDRQYLTLDEFRAKAISNPILKGAIDADSINDILIVATENVEKYTERIFTQQTYSETFRGDNTTTHLVWEYPIVSVTSLYQDTIANPTVTTTYDTANRLVRTSVNDESGRIEIDGLDTITSFAAGNLYRLTYVGGYASIPPAVKHATALWATELLRQNYGVGKGTPELIPMTTEQIVEILNPIRRRRI